MADNDNDNEDEGGNNGRNGNNGVGRGSAGNVVRIPSLAERDRKRREQLEAQQAGQATGRAAGPSRTGDEAGPMINLPPITKYMLGLLFVIFIVTRYMLPESWAVWILFHFGFVPGAYTGTIPLSWPALFAPLTHMLFHAGWVHLGMNALMLSAFGSGMERWLGGRRFVLLFLGSGLIGAGVHFAFYPFSAVPVIGASGGLSGLFAAALVMINKKMPGLNSGRYGMWPVILLWLFISVLFGVMGSPDGNPVAWAAHIGGFAGGFAILRLMKLF